MRKRFSVLVVIVIAMMMIVPAVLAAPSNVIYDSTNSPLAPNLPSLCYQATSTAEFGDRISFAGSDRTLETVTVTMSAWALNSSYPSMDSAGFNHPITMNLYQVDNSGPVPMPGSVIASNTETFLVPWRPEADPTCTGNGWRASDGACYNGFAFNIEFDFAGVVVPDEIIYGLAYNTQTHGYNPIGASGPYNSLNFGLSDAAPSTGTDIDADGVYWNTSFAGFYSDGGASGVGTFRQDTGWAPYTPAVQFVAVDPQPATQDDCKKGGFADFGFKNQGQCIKFVNTGKDSR